MGVPSKNLGMLGGAVRLLASMAERLLVARSTGLLMLPFRSDAEELRLPGRGFFLQRADLLGQRVDVDGLKEIKVSNRPPCNPVQVSQHVF